VASPVATDHGPSKFVCQAYLQSTDNFRAADASSHLFFGYLRSRAPEAVDGITGISNLPRSLQALVAQTEYPPETPALPQTSTAKVLMMVDSVSPTPLSLLRRAKNFEYRSEDRDLQYFSEYLDPMQALTSECLRVLDCIASANQSAARAKRGNLANSRLPSGLSITGDDSWARFQDEGFSGFTNEATTSGDRSNRQSPQIGSLQSEARSRGMAGDRPTTPSWADFLNSGFADEARSKSTPALMLPPDKQLPPLSPGGTNGINLEDEDLEPGELASITTFRLDDTFWWVWMMSLSDEEPAGRKAAFGRCALIETSIAGGKWFLMEEQVKGAAAVLTEGAYIAEKKSRFGFSRRNRSTRKKPAQPQQLPEHVDSASAAFRATSTTPNKGSMTLDQQARIKAAAAELSQQETGQHLSPDRRGRNDDAASTKTNSVLTLGLTNTANPAMEWAKAYDKEEVRRQYLGDNFAGKGLSNEERSLQAMSTDFSDKENQPVRLTSFDNHAADRDLPPVPAAEARPEPAQVLSSDVLPAPLPPQPQRAAPVQPEQSAPLATRAAEVHLPPVTPREEPAETLTSQVYAIPMPRASMPAVSNPSAIVPTQGRQENKSPDMEESSVPETPTYNESGREYAAPMDTSVSPNVTRVERKPVSEAKVHPAFRNQSSEPSSVETSPSSQKQSSKNAPAQVAAARAFWQSQAKPTDKVPASEEHEHKKLNKKDRVPTAGALKKMFGRKKEAAGGRSTNMAARERTLAPPSESKVGRSMSLMRKKPVSRGAESVSAAPTPGNKDSAERQHSSSVAQEAPFVSEYTPSEHEYLARTDTKDTNNAKQEFSRFDQGPMTDAPTFVPNGPVSPLEYEQYDPDRTPNADENSGAEYVSPPRPHLETQHESVYTTPLMEADDEMHPGYGTADDQGTHAVEAPVLDRWAQIRKNAAERAARVSEEQSTRSRGQSIATEGASETSGEESEYSRGISAGRVTDL